MTFLEIALLAILVIMFIIATKWPVNIGLLGYAGAFIVGVFMLGMKDKEILEEFPASIVVTIIGVTFFFSLAQKNGTIDFVVNSLIHKMGHRTYIVPWVFFLIAAGLTALGTFSPAAVALLAPAAMAFSARTGYNPVVMGAMIINGAHAGAFSPISVSGNIVRDIGEKNGMNVDMAGLFLASFVINLFITILTVLVIRMIGKLYFAPEEHVLDATTGIAAVPNVHKITWRIGLTFALIAVMVVAAVGFRLNIGFLGITLGVILAFTMLKKTDNLISGISWSTILLVTGMMLYISLLTRAGVIDSLSNAAMALGIPIVVAAFLCYVIGVSSAFASSTALITAFVPMAAPLLAQSDLSPTAVLAALAVSATIVDVSPVSTNGALIIASTQGRAKKTIWKDLVIYAGFVILIAPGVAWALLVPTGIM
ncbi:MAG: SLC13 family permease [Rothia sp. (in: high G+C Gram-positive bacteria)]|nr:SLC13 family permease [Rothia sp. (in: high G+C Gram-positive bacteria)]